MKNVFIQVTNKDEGQKKEKKMTSVFLQRTFFFLFIVESSHEIR